ncbi:MAG TPA: alpha/beta fold hydrolase [Solirubrobacteraceae bacterium]|nr:alpha/beta fold hydrolase [Solirubrobacteraceae bacterium]
MEQEIRFCAGSRGRIAYAATGDGPALVVPAWWVSHQEVLWDEPGFRGFVTALAERHTVIRYDRPGTGLSERAAGAELAIAAELEVLDELLDHLGVERCSLFGFSAGGALAGAYAAAHPRRVQRLVLYGSHARGDILAEPEARRQLVSVVRAHWGVGSRLLAAVFVPDGGAESLDWFARFQRASASPETAARLLEAIYAIDERDAFRAIAAPTLVLHRTGDRAVPVEAGREVAALVPGARFRSFPGATHPPWQGDTAALLDAIADFMHLGSYTLPETGPAEADAAALTGREREVLRLVADGLSNEEIAARLALSEHTIHRHIANIRAKLDTPSRGAAAAAAIRAGII